MRFVLYALAAFSLVWGLFAMMLAKTAIHEIQGGIAFLMFAVFLSGAAICSQLARDRKERVSSAPERSSADRSYPPS